MSLRFCLILILSFFTLYAVPQHPGRLISDSALVHGSVSLCILDAVTGITVVEVNQGRSLTPASVLKLVTTAAALEKLGPRYYFTTTLGYSGTISKSGRLDGDILIRGGGDPVFASGNFQEHYAAFPGGWADEIKNMGITRITGKVITDDSYYDYLPVPAKWLWEDAGNYYGAGAYGASLYDNTYKIHLQTFSDSTLIFKGITPEECRFDFSNWLVAAGTTDQGYVFAAPYSSSGWLAGSVPVNRDDFVLKASITDPPKLLATIVDRKLRDSGIKINGEPSTVRIDKSNVPGDIIPVLSINSPPLSAIIEILNHESVNLYAEHLLKELGKKFRNRGSTAAGVEVIYEFLENAGVNTSGVYIEDGSGLSPLNAINAKALSELLLYMKNKGAYFSEYIRSFPDAGREGTLKTCFRDEIFATSLHAKSGSMTRVRSYAGYLTTRSGRELVFSFIANDFSGPSRHIVTLFEDYLKDVINNL
jgi:serine-type D-Ala-D-Ala carboxypeptidase/endopeptidase (penicillin-binding protein 4)